MSENYNIIDDRPKKWGAGSFCRFCLHFNGIEKETCKAYPEGSIPDKFTYGKTIHLNVEPGQTDDYVFTPAPEYDRKQ